MFSNKYMYKNRLNELSKDSIARNCKAFGYMDGYLDEEIYSSIFEYNDNNNANFEMINAYMYETEILDDSEEQVYTFGYMDGYFDEYVYGDASYSEDLAYLYEIGYHEGEMSRNANLAKANLEKLKWLVSLSINDSLNGIHNRELSIDARSVYNSHYQFLDDDVMNDEGVLDNKLSDEEYFRFRHKRCCK